MGNRIAGEQDGLQHTGNGYATIFIRQWEEALFLFQCHFSNGCNPHAWHFFIRVKSRSMLCFVSGAWKVRVQVTQGFGKKYYPKGGDFFSNLPDLVKPSRTRSYLCSEETDISYWFLAWNQSWKLWGCHWKNGSKSQTKPNCSTGSYSRIHGLFAF